MLTEFCTFEDIRLWRRKLEHRNSFSVSSVFSVKVMYSRVFEGSFSVLLAFPVKVMYSWVFQGWFHIPNHHHFSRLFICTVDFPIRDSALRLQPCRTNLFSSMASRMFSKSSRWPRHLPQGKGKKPLRHRRLRRFIKLHYPLQVPPVSGSDHPTRAQGHKRPHQGTCPLCQVPLQAHRCKLRFFSHLGLKPGPQRPPRNPLSVSTNTVPRPSMSPQEQQRKRLKESTPTTLPPGNWRQEFGVYDPYRRNIETDETSENESRHAPPTDNEAPFNAFGAADPRNVPDTTGPRNVPDTAAVSLTSEQTEIRAWFRAHQDRVCQLDDGFIRWLSRLLDQNQITPAEMGWTLVKKFFTFCHCLIFGRLHKSRSLNHQHLGEHFLAIQLLNMLHLFMLLQLEAWRAFFIQERFHLVFCMTQIVCHFLH